MPRCGIEAMVAQAHDAAPELDGGFALQVGAHALQHRATSCCALGGAEAGEGGFLHAVADRERLVQRRLGARLQLDGVGAAVGLAGTAP